ncbi:hypothetical protein LPW26_20475 [Rhodopseudomonas sp. HC1]|uniref:hypothetical protein n=1 Tax=Rhodopseudomonas infernalis TaxID=2897386 RepID=UPI001EE80B81|nr:hypothetical protein [Rhodopseudomonas infernalis]MCG6207027.1 hypothetical protein [Rhodopseudomonas infernalis]
MPISLRGTVAFEPEFVGNLNMLTRTMIARGLDPDEYVISKDIASAPTLPFVGPMAYDYVVIGAADDELIVTDSCDQRFLEHFLRHIGSTVDQTPPPVEPGMFARLSRWMSPAV